MIVLVAGGAGYIGSRLIRDLPKGPRYEFLEGDVRNESDVRTAVRDIDTVFSLSDITNAPVSFERKDLTWEVNHKGALHLFERAIEAGVRKFVYTSTCSVYGPTEGLVTEDA